MADTNGTTTRLIPAEHWFAAYELDHEPYLRLERLIAFVAIHEGGGFKVDGVDAGRYLCYGRSRYDEKTDSWTFPRCLGFYHEADLTKERREELAAIARKGHHEGT